MREIESLVTRATDTGLPRSERLHAFATIVRRFQDMAVGYAYSRLGDFQLAEDVAQEAFVSAWRQLDSLHQPRAFGAWFKRILHTQCGRMTRGQPGRATSLDETAEVASSAPTPYEQVERDALRSRIQDAIEALPEHERTTAILRYINGYTQAEIADFLEAPLGTVKYRLHSARKRLRKGLADTAREDLYARRPSRDDEFVKTVLFEAVKEADVEKVATLLPEHPTLVDSRDDLGHTPMQALGRRRHFITASDSMKSREAIVAMLVARGSEPDIVTAITVGDVTAVRAIAKTDPDALRSLVAVPSWKGITPLAVACGHGRLDVVEALLDLDPSTVNVVGEDGATAFDTLTRPWHPSALDDDALSHRREVYDLLVRHGGEPSIGHAIVVDDIDRIGSWMDADPISTLGDGSPLNVAAEYGRLAILERLHTAARDVGVDVQPQLDHSLTHSFGDIVCEWLIAHGANLDPLPGAAYSPLTQASEVYQPEKIQLLLSHGADPTAPTHARYQYDMTQTLRPSDGEMPPLFVAIGTWYGPREEVGAMGECLEIIEILIQGGADADRTYLVDLGGNLVSLTARQFARRLADMFPDQGFQEIVDLLAGPDASSTS